MINEQFIDILINVLLEMRLDERSRESRAKKIMKRERQRQEGEKLGGGRSTPEHRNQRMFGSGSDQGSGMPKSPKQDDQETDQRKEAHKMLRGKKGRADEASEQARANKAKQQALKKDKGHRVDKLLKGRFSDRGISAHALTKAGEARKGGDKKEARRQVGRSQKMDEPQKIP